MSNGVLVLYFDQISSEKDVCVELVVQHAFKVGDAKDANVKIYDYYQPEHSKSVSYNLPNGGCFCCYEVVGEGNKNWI